MILDSNRHETYKLRLSRKRIQFESFQYLLLSAVVRAHTEKESLSTAKQRSSTRTSTHRRMKYPVERQKSVKMKQQARFMQDQITLAPSKRICKRFHENSGKFTSNGGWPGDPEGLGHSWGVCMKNRMLSSRHYFEFRLFSIKIFVHFYCRTRGLARRLTSTK